MGRFRLSISVMLLLSLLLPLISAGAIQADLGGSTLVLDRHLAQEAPLAPETLSWSQRSIEEWAPSDLLRTEAVLWDGWDPSIVLAPAHFKRSPAGELYQRQGEEGAWYFMVPLDVDGDGDIDLAAAPNRWDWGDGDLFLNDGSGLLPDPSGRIDLSGLPPNLVPAIRLRATLADHNAGPDYYDDARTPRLRSWSVSFTMAQEPPRTLQAHQVVSPPAIDGDLSDWPPAIPLRLDKNTADTVRVRPGGSPPPEPWDSSADLRVAWDEDALYLALHVGDDLIVNDSANVWEDDEIELAIDGAGDRLPGGADDHQYTINPDGRLTDFGAPSPPPNIQVAIQAVPGGWDVEVRVPAGELGGAILALDRQLGFSLGLHDDDDGGSWESFMIWEGDNTFNGTADFGTLQLAESWEPPIWQQANYIEWRTSEFSNTHLVSNNLQRVDAGEFDDTPGDTPVVLDADGDGDMDLAGQGMLYLNDGSGAYRIADAGDYNGVLDPPVVLDADGDGDSDLVAGGLLYRNNGAGQFAQADAGTVDWGIPLDADADGDLDIAWLAALYVNDGTGYFAQVPAGDLDDMTSPYLRDLAALDADGDGDLDLAVAGSARVFQPCIFELGTLTCYWAPNALLLNDGTGIFSEVDAGQFVAGFWDGHLFTEDLAAFDADGDGDTDLLEANFGFYQPWSNHPPEWGSHPNMLYLNDGTGYFTRGPALGGGYTISVALLDVDGDGDSDVAFANSEDLGGVTGRDPNQLWLNEGEGHFTQVDPGEFGLALINPIASLDADQDGQDDVVTGHELYYSNWNGGTCIELSPLVFVETDAGDYHGGKTIPLDADGDGDIDLAVVEQGLLLNDGSGRYTLAASGDFGALPGPQVALDVDGDGDVDLAIPGSLFLNHGNATFSLTPAGDFDNASGYWLTVTRANGDDLPDLVMPGALYLNNGNVSFTHSPAGDFDVVPDIVRLRSADFDGDGDDDLVAGDWTGWSTGLLRLFLNNGSGTYQEVTTGIDYSDGLNSFIEIFDADMDGDFDIAIGGDPEEDPQNPGSTNALVLNNGDATFTAVDSGEFDDDRNQHSSLAAFDMDGDGDQDLAVVAFRGDYLFRNDGNAQFTRIHEGDFHAYGGMYSRERDILAAFDADGDGDMDLGTEAALFRYEGLADSGQVTSFVAPSMMLPGSGQLREWQMLAVVERLATDTTITYSILDPGSGEPVPGFADLRPDGAGLIDLSGLDPNAYPAIHLEAMLRDLHPGPDHGDRSPELCAWQVTFEVGPEPTPTPQPTATPTLTATATGIPVPTLTPTATATGTPVPTATATATWTASQTPSTTPTSTSTPTAAPTAVAHHYLPLILRQ